MKVRFRLPMHSWKNSKVFISGGSNGIGFEVIKILLEKGAEVHNVDRFPPEIEFENLHHYKCDLLKEEPSLKTDEFDLIILNVAKNPGIKPFDSYSLEDVESTIFLNITTHLRMMKILKYKKAIFINSVCSFVGLPEFSLYCATKSFMATLCESLRREGKDVYIIYPYKINTHMFSEMKDFFPLERAKLACTIVRDIEKNTTERTVPMIFSVTPFLKSITPNFIFDIIMKWVTRIFKKELKPCRRY